MPEVEHMRLADRPAFVRKLVATWRRQHLAAGEDMHILIWPGEWPDDHERTVRDIPVEESDQTGGTGGIIVLGRARGQWRLIYQLATPHLLAFSPDELAIVCVYLAVPDNESDPMKVWMHPDPHTGQVPMWEVQRHGRR